MSAIEMHCNRCGSNFFAGVVGSTPWPAHVCPDGTRDAPTASGWLTHAPRSGAQGTEVVSLSMKGAKET